MLRHCVSAARRGPCVERPDESMVDVGSSLGHKLATNIVDEATKKGDRGW